MSDQAASYHDLAAWYDALYDARGKDYEGEALGLLDVARERVEGPVGSLLDVACGSGRHLEVFARHLPEVAGLDNSHEMLTVAAARLGGVALTEADLRSFDLEREFDVVTCLFSSIGHVEDGGQLDEAVASMGRHVRAGGVLIIEPWLTPDRVERGGIRDLDTAETDEGVIARVSNSRVEDGALVVEFAWAVATPAGVATAQERHRMPLFSRDRYLDAMAGAGFEGEWLDELPGVASRRGWLIGRPREV